MKTEKTISDFLDYEYINFAKYVIENRAIPSIVDGFKPTARKAFYVGLKYCKNKVDKVSTLSGRLISDAQYHNGNTSAESVIVTMAQKYKNGLPIFDGIGQFGTLRDPYPSASRYISVKLNNNILTIFKDNELLKYQDIDGMLCEPLYYLPIVPMVLVNNASGIAVAFATNILNRSIKDIINNCLKFLKKEKIKLSAPIIDGFTGTFIKDVEKNRWIITGNVLNINATTYEITELPPNMTFQKYESFLDGLLESGDLVDYKNNCHGKISYVLKFRRNFFNDYSETDILKYLKLIEYETENFTVLDEFGKLKIFDNAEDILKHFVTFRLTFYQKRKDYQIDQINNQINILDNKIRFIKSIIDELLIVNNRKKDMIEKDLVVLKFDKVENNFDYLLRMPIYSLTKETYDRLREDMNVKKQELVDVKKSKPIDTYIKELEDLKKII